MVKKFNVSVDEASAKESKINERVRLISESTAEDALRILNTSRGGPDEKAVMLAREKYGNNKLTEGKKESLPWKIYKSFVNPFTIILLALAGASLCTDVILADPGDRSYTAVGIITAMVAISGTLRFVQERRSGNAAAKLQQMIWTTAAVTREGKESEMPLEDIVVGDIVSLSAGDIVPADCRVIEAIDLFISQSA